LSTIADQITRPVQVIATPALGGEATDAPERPVSTARVCAVIVTWNRKAYLTSVLQALARQTYPRILLDVVVVDNAGTDGTLDHLCASFNPERVVDNDTDKAHEPRFDAPRVRGWEPPGRPGAPNTLGLSSLSIVRNRANMGGCGGFNTGFAFVEQWFCKQGLPGPDFVWLVDDDADLPPDALSHLVRVMESDPTIGLVGSRTCDINDRARTIETTIYFNADSGTMQDDAPAGHPRHEQHKSWIATVGGPRGQGGAEGYRGTMDVDVVSACSMLSRWRAVLGAPAADGKPATKGVGYWDHRYFIYCDDADWCLRFARAGWRVVLSLDAVVFHTPWNLKLTPARIYYANRNRLWMVQKTLPPDRLRAVTEKVMRSFLFDSLHAATHRRQFHARIILRTGLDAAQNVSGKTGSDGPPAIPTAEAFAKANLLRGGRVAVLASSPDALRHFTELKRIIAAHVKATPGAVEPIWVPIVRNDVPNPPAGSIVYGRHRGSRLKKQWHTLLRRPRAVVVFDQVNDFPVLLCAPWTIHIDSKKPEMAQIERDGWLPRLAFLARWLAARPKLLRYARTVKPFASETRYG
jgi:GT2 family glycosyltransferase